MSQVLVRNLDDRVVASLRRKAELHGHSLEQELRLAPDRGRAAHT
jgi:plasmid stability protein